MSLLKQYIPTPVKLKVKLLQRKFKDYRSGDAAHFAKPARPNATEFPFQISLSQPIKVTATSAGKQKNFAVAIKAIEALIVYPNQIFSFWNCIGAPSKQKGFAEGRTLVNGVLVPTIGGGLCQLSGLMYHIALLSGLSIVERHNHSIDIYTDETRYTPLGSDATVAFGYKDLRFKNTHSFPICFAFTLLQDKLSVHLKSTKPILPKEVEFKREKETTSTVTVLTLCNQKKVASSKYQKQ